jgi:hypothetical protein
MAILWPYVYCRMSAVGYGAAVTGRVGAAAYLPLTAARQPGEDACTTGESAVSGDSTTMIRRSAAVRLY